MSLHPARLITPVPLLVLCVTLCAVVTAPLRADAAATLPAQDAGPRHVILLIGDGMGEHQITIARNYLAGAAGKLRLDTLPVRATVQVLGVEDSVDGGPDYVADSANTATAMASGEVTSRGRIGTAAGSGNVLPNIVELATARGYRTGLVTTASVTDATPAAFAAHINFRRCENPSQMNSVIYKTIYLGECRQHLKANGGAGSIAEQLAESGMDILLGGGRKHFLHPAETGHGTVLDLASKNGFHVVGQLNELDADSPPRVLGLFAPGTLPVRLRGSGDRVAERPRPDLLNQVSDHLGKVTLPEPMSCEANPAYGNTPSLKAMTETALAHLSRGNQRGFFLMVESASIDKQSHERRPCGSIGEVAQLQEALVSALDFARDNPDTLILVTADHTHAAQLVPETTHYAAYPVPVYTPGHLARVITPEGGIMGINYATNNFPYEEHTGASVPLYANAVGREWVPSFLRQPELFDLMRDYLGLAEIR